MLLMQTGEETKHRDNASCQYKWKQRTNASRCCLWCQAGSLANIRHTGRHRLYCRNGSAMHILTNTEHNQQWYQPIIVLHYRFQSFML